MPPGSQGAICNVSEAYWNIPIHVSQWPETVVQIPSNNFVVDLYCAFGVSSACGVFGSVDDAAADILRASGIGPLSKWVDTLGKGLGVFGENPS